MLLTHTLQNENPDIEQQFVQAAITQSMLETPQPVFTNIIDFFSKSISQMQFGFLHNHSTLQQLLIFLSDIYNSFTHNTPTDVLYLDFKKAFDIVAHN